LGIGQTGHQLESSDHSRRWFESGERDRSGEASASVRGRCFQRC